MSRRITLEQWIKEACEDKDKLGTDGQQKACSMIALLHVKATGVGTEEVHSKTLDSKTQSFSALAKFFENKACAFAQDLTGIQTFRLQAFYGSNEPQASHTFTVYEGALTAGEAAPWSKHEPTATGLLAQLMKHNEALSTDNRQIVQGVLGMLMTERVEVQKERMEMNLLMRDVLLNLRKEAHAEGMEKLRYQRESEERAALFKLAPGMVNALTGTEIVPINTVDSQIIEALALKVTPQQLQGMVAMGVISQEMMPVIMNRMKQIRDEAEKRANLLKAGLPPEESNPQGASVNGAAVEKAS